ncbi:hypothetical protein GGD81_001469 [Rhodobium orientis]|uniref:Uncharacterized protein n=1 Tax=Rhodobium gokarnense TaxID=364296 RepID=A0ABT3HB46_9HYPH|nr:hypothetical protein [Rhodobium orientis]MCW2307615.1 hypothetical protein [Rhodobium gokarnense]
MCRTVDGLCPPAVRAFDTPSLRQTDNEAIR